MGDVIEDLFYIYFFVGLFYLTKHGGGYGSVIKLFTLNASVD
jgi:hypothetical protein